MQKDQVPSKESTFCISMKWFQKINIAKMYATIQVPAFEFKFNLVVCPLQGTSKNVSKIEQIAHLLSLLSFRVTASSMF